jgi:hypothetical protein
MIVFKNIINIIKDINMQSSFFERKTSSNQTDKNNSYSLSPTELYFAEKIKGTVDLKPFELAACNYVESINENIITPPDHYFRQKLNLDYEIEHDIHGFIPRTLSEALLKEYEQKSLDYVLKLMSANTNKDEVHSTGLWPKFPTENNLAKVLCFKRRQRV